MENLAYCMYGGLFTIHYIYIYIYQLAFANHIKIFAAFHCVILIEERLEIPILNCRAHTYY